MSDETDANGSIPSAGNVDHPNDQHANAAMGVPVSAIEEAPQGTPAGEFILPAQEQQQQQQQLQQQQQTHNGTLIMNANVANVNGDVNMLGSGDANAGAANNGVLLYDPNPLQQQMPGQVQVQGQGQVQGQSTGEPTNMDVNANAPREETEVHIANMPVQEQHQTQHENPINLNANGELAQTQVHTQVQVQLQQQQVQQQQLQVQQGQPIILSVPIPAAPAAATAVNINMQTMPAPVAPAPGQVHVANMEVPLPVPTPMPGMVHQHGEHPSLVQVVQHVQQPHSIQHQVQQVQEHMDYDAQGYQVQLDQHGNPIQHEQQQQQQIIQHEQQDHVQVPLTVDAQGNPVQMQMQQVHVQEVQEHEHEQGDGQHNMHQQHEQVHEYHQQDQQHPEHQDHYIVQHQQQHQHPYQQQQQQQQHPYHGHQHLPQDQPQQSEGGELEQQQQHAHEHEHELEHNHELQHQHEEAVQQQPVERSWHDFFIILQTHSNTYATLDIEPGSNPPLEEWVAEQRVLYQEDRRGNETSLTAERRLLLDALGFEWEVGVGHNAMSVGEHVDGVNVNVNGNINEQGHELGDNGDTVEVGREHGQGVAMGAVTDQEGVVQAQTQEGDVVHQHPHSHSQGIPQQTYEDQNQQHSQAAHDQAASAAALEAEIQDVAAFNARLGQLQQFKEIHGHPNVPHDFKEDDLGMGSLGLADIGKWAAVQCDLYHKGTLGQDRVDALVSMGFEFQIGGSKFPFFSFEARIQQLSDYKALNGDIKIPRKSVPELHG